MFPEAQDDVLKKAENISLTARVSLFYQTNTGLIASLTVKQQFTVMLPPIAFEATFWILPYR